MMPHVSANAGVSIELKYYQIGHSQNTYNHDGFENQKRGVIFELKREVKDIHLNYAYLCYHTE